MTAYESHTVKSYDQALSQMTGDCASMGKLVEEQLRQAAEALQARNNDIATETSKRDLEVNALESSINQQGLKMLALRQPMASDTAFQSVPRLVEWRCTAARRAASSCRSETHGREE